VGLFDAIFRRFRRKPDIYRKISHPKLVVPFDFPYTVLKDPSPADMLTAWRSAPRDNGTPVIIVWDDAMQCMWAAPSDVSKNVDLDAIFKPAIDELFTDADGPETLGKPSDRVTEPFSISPLFNDEAIVCLAQIPVSESWQILRHIPFGGWNNCPDAGVSEAFLKELYERYGAVPAIVRSDTLELVPARHPDVKEAYELALRMYAFCPDLVSQITGSIHALADALRTSDVWYMWWD
jgi:hypothetical protein